MQSSAETTRRAKSARAAAVLGRRSPQELEDVSRDPFAEPINQGPPAGVDDDLNFEAGQGTVGVGTEELSEFGDLHDAAQREDESGISGDMSGFVTTSGASRFAGAGDVGPDAASGLQAGPLKLHPNGDFGDLDDAAIMLELKAGNMAAFDFLLAKFRRPIVNFMYRMTRNQAVAEELAQEVFLRVYRSRETYRAEARFSTWVYRIATNLGVNHARDTRHERSASTVYLDEADSETGSTPDVADSTPDVEAKLLRDERMSAIRDHVMALPERQRMAVLMHKYEGMDYKQIGDVLKLSESATKSLLFRAYQTLREKLKNFV